MIPKIDIYRSQAGTFNILEKAEDTEVTAKRVKEGGEGSRINHEIDVGSQIARKQLHDRACAMEPAVAAETSKSSGSRSERPGPGDGAAAVDGFKELKVCSPTEEIKLVDLARQLQGKSPEMLWKILKNCQWLKGKVKDEFIHGVALQSIGMELEEIFDQSQLENIQKGVRPTKGLLVPRILQGWESARVILSDLAVFNGIHEKFFAWLDKNGKPPARNLKFSASPRLQEWAGLKPGTPSHAQNCTWYEWISGELYFIRDAINDNVLMNSKRVSSRPSWAKETPETPKLVEMLAAGIIDESNFYASLRTDAGFKAKCQGIAPYVATSYAYTQLILRHVKFPGQTDEDPPSLHAVRMVKSDGFESLFGKDFFTPSETSKKGVYRCDAARSAESWGLMSPAENNDYGDMRIYGQIPIYSIASGFFSIKGAGSIQKELVVLPLSDINVIVENKNVPVFRFYEETVIPIAEAQYAGDEYVAEQIREAKRLLEEARQKADDA
ncbi:MAG: hypothetical protein LBK24_02710 [Puniceicoccales bacterium]|jgi:hypothetical protein|nr:hypothetical protein [Puniceicoccales bacterium]